jgi:hypothetical protein
MPSSKKKTPSLKTNFKWDRKGRDNTKILMNMSKTPLISLEISNKLMKSSQASRKQLSTSENASLEIFKRNK